MKATFRCRMTFRVACLVYGKYIGELFLFFLRSSAFYYVIIILLNVTKHIGFT